MSLFKTRDSWSTLCGKDEEYDIGCLVVADIFAQGCDCMIVGGHSGILRIFQPQSDPEGGSLDYRPTDLLVESQLSCPIIQVAIGKLVSGTQNVQIGILHPQSVAVYSLVSFSGSAQHGDHYQLVLAYEHQLSKPAFSFIIGPFGGVKGRDFICVQSLDGSLSFFEQETFAVSRSLSCFLIPSVFVYVPSSDSFVIFDANWTLECFRYELLADLNRKLVPWWSVNIGEPVVDMQVVVGGGKAMVCVLGERHLYWVREGGSVELVRRLQFSPCCLHAYLTEPDGRLLVLVVADTSTLLIYDLTSLCWTSQLPFIPVSISRVNVKSVKGLIVLLSDEGHIICCHLGTEPAVFMAPPLSNNALTYDNLQNKFTTLQHEINSALQNAGGALQVNEGHQLNVITRSVYSVNEDLCQLLIHLSPSTSLSGVQITVSVTAPLTVHPSVHHLPNLCETTEVSSVVTFLPTHAVPVQSADVQLVAVYVSPQGGPRVLQVTSALPIAMLLRPTTPTKEAEHKITLSLTQPTVPLNQLFSDLAGEEWEARGCSENVMGVEHCAAPHQSTTVVVSKGSPRYRLQADNMSALYLVLTQLTVRIESYYAAKDKTVKVSYPAATLPLTPLLNMIDKHVELRNSSISLQEILAKQTTQYRAFQRRLLNKLRERTVLPLVSLDKILADTHNQISKTVHSIQDTQLALDVCGSELGCLVRLALVLSRLCDTTSAKDWTDLAAAISYVTHSSENQGWEEVCESGINYLLSTSLAKSVRDHQRTMLDPLKDTARFKKHIVVALDRVIAGSDIKVKEEQPRGVSPILEGEEEFNLKPKGDDCGASLNLLPLRKDIYSHDKPRTLEEAVQE